MSKKTMEELMTLPHETLCEMAVKGEITWSEWIAAHGSEYAGYTSWLKDKGYDAPSDQAALEFIKECEEKLMDAQLDESVQKVMDSVETIKLMQDRINFI